MITMPIEPLMTNRWVLSFEGMNVPDYVFRKFKLYNEGDEMVFETEFIETVQYTYNPADIFNIVALKLEFVDPTGSVVGGFTSDIKGTNFIKFGDYGGDGVLTTKLTFTLKIETLKSISLNTEKNEK